MKNVIISKEPTAQPGEIVQYVREDNFTVFLDNDKELDFIRTHCEPKIIIQAVALRRAQQIAQNYARKHRPELLDEFKVTPLLNEPQKRKIGFVDTAQYCTVCGNEVTDNAGICQACKTEVK